MANGFADRRFMPDVVGRQAVATYSSRRSTPRR
jgi:hypothetical protein